MVTRLLYYVGLVTAAILLGLAVGSWCLYLFMNLFPVVIAVIAVLGFWVLYVAMGLRHS